ncbi:MAG: hypothetical protein K2X66_03935, partial [Cyanobacteria bacterium]|nr:hypothetical protein [Cyanobacteriota bacterium]
NTSNFTSQSVTFQGKPFFNAYDLSVSLGILGQIEDLTATQRNSQVYQNNQAIQKTLKTEFSPFDDPRKYTDEIIPTGTLLTSFIQEYMKAKDGNFLKNNPEARALIKAISQDITVTSDSLESSINFNVNKSTLGNVQALTADLIKRTEDYSTKTNQNSQTICKTGGGQDTGDQCH